MKEESRLLSGICKKKLALIYTFKFRNSEDIYFKNWNVRTTVSGSALKWLRTPHFRTFILLAVFGARWFWCHLRMITMVIWHFIVWKLPKLTYLGLTAFTSLHSRLHFDFSPSCAGEGNGNPLQCSCLENPRDGGAWWSSVYPVAQSRTRLKRISSSSRPHSPIK